MTKSRKIGPLTIRPEVKEGKETGKWFLDIPASLTNTGIRKRPRYDSRTQAETVARELKREMEMKRLGYVSAAAERRVSFREAAERWDEGLELSVRTGDIRALSARTYRTRLQPLTAFFRDQAVSEIDANSIARYKAHRRDEGRKPVTVNGELRTLRRLLGWLVDQGELSTLPKVTKIKEVRRWLEVPTASEVVRLLDHLRPEVRVLVWLMAETGLRPSEAQRVPWAHVDAKRGAILIKPFGEDAPKNQHSERAVYPSADLMRELLRLSRKGDYIFPGTNPAKPIQNVRTTLKTAAKKAGLMRDGKPYVPTVKLFRKAFATSLAEAGVNQSVLASLMGHAPGSRMTEQYYTFIGDDAKRSNRVSLHALAARVASQPEQSGNFGQ